MAKSKLVGLLLEAWNDIDRVVAGLPPAEAARSLDAGRGVQRGLPLWRGIQGVSP